MSKLARHLDRKTIPQTEALPGQVPNAGGGFSYAVDDWTRLDRWLTLGAEAGTYYAGERELTIANAAVVERCMKLDGVRTVNKIVEISDAGRAPKNDPAIMALAICMKKGSLDTRRAAAAALPHVCRIGTHLFHLAAFIEALGGGWGRGTRRAFANWYLAQRPGGLALQAIKYQQRDGWSHRDVLRVAHPKAANVTTNAILNWMVKGWEGVGTVPHEDMTMVKIWAFERTKDPALPRRELIKLIEDYGLPHECVPNDAKGDPDVWRAMVPHMGLTAMIRNLGKMTAVGALAPLSNVSIAVRAALGDVEAMRKARIHPLSLLVALKIYAQGHGDKGSLKWEPVQQVVDALDAAFYESFKVVEPTGKRHMLALDISGSMTMAKIAGMPITPRDASAAMALVTMNVETEYAVLGFSHKLMPLKISPRQRLDDVVSYINGLPFGGTDAALPILAATANRIPVDAFVTYTDSEVNGASMHPKVALDQYRQKMGIGAKLVMVGMTAGSFTLSDPSDAGMLDISGFDTATPAVLSDFVRG